MTRRISIRLILLAGAGCLWAQKNVVSLSGPMTEAIYALGAQDRLAGVTDTSVFPQQVMSDRKSGKIRMLGSFSQPDLAAIDSIHPTLILTSTAFQRDLASRLRAKGYRVLHYEPASLDAIMANIDELGAALGKSKEAAKYTGGMRRELAEVVTKSSALPRMKVYLEINHVGPWTDGAKSPLNDSIRSAGGENNFGDRAEDVMVVKNEEVVRRNPDVILSPIWLDARSAAATGLRPCSKSCRGRGTPRPPRFVIAVCSTMIRRC